MVEYLYDELVQITKGILPYYDVDKVKLTSVYIWTKGENGENVFDIHCDKIILYDEKHIIVEEAMPIILQIQEKLKQINQG